MSLPPLKVKIGADTEGLTSGVDKANKKLGSMTDTARKVGRSVDNISDRAKNLGRQMSVITGAITAAGAGLFLLTKRSAESANQIGKAAQTAGVSAEAFQEAAFAIGQMSDVTDQQFGMALQRLNRRMGLAAEGNKTYGDALASVGITQEDIASGAVDTEEAFRRLVAQTEQMESSAQAAAVSSALLGDEVGPKIGAALRSNSGAFEENIQRARELGIVMSGDFVRQSEGMVDQFDVLSRQMEKLRSDIAEKFIPILIEDLIPAIQDKIIPAFVSFIEKIGEVITWFQDLPGPVQEAIGIVAAAIGAGGPLLVALGVMGKAFTAIIAAGTGPIGLFIAAASLAVAAWVKWGDEIKAAVGGAIDWIGEKITALTDWLQGLIDKAVAVKEAITDALSFGGSGVNPDSPIAGPGGPFGNRDAAPRGFANGTLSAPGGTAIVGERGPEVVNLPGGSSVTPNHKLGSGGSAGGFGGGGFGGGMGGIGGQGMGDVGGFGALGDMIAAGIVQGVGLGLEEREEQLREHIRRVPNVAREELQINSPSKVFDGIGRFIGEGLANGIDATTGLSEKALKSHTDNMEDGAWDTADSVLGAMSSMFKGSKPIAIAQALINTYQGVTEALKKPFPANIAAAAAVAAQGMSAIAQIRSANPGSGGGGGGAAAASGAGAAASQAQAQEQQQAPTTTFQFTLQNDPMGFGEQFARQMVEQLNEAQRNGGQVRGVIA